MSSVATLRERLRPVGEGRTLAVLLPFLIGSTANYALYTFVALLLETHLPATAIPALLFLFGVGGVAGNLIGGALYDAFGTARPTWLCLVLLIGALAAAQPASSSLVAAGIDMAVWAVCMASLFTLQQQRAIAVGPQPSNLRLALNNSAMYLGASIGSLLGGIIILRASVAALPLASAVIATVGLATLFVLSGKDNGTTSTFC
jgi:MFS transporter, DHA1 family, inner membrane transport protein